MRLLAVALLLVPLAAGCVAPWDPCSDLRGGECVLLRGVVAEVPFEVEWNATKASQAVAAMGYSVREADAIGLVALHQDWPRLIIQVDGGTTPHWRMRAEYDAASGQPMTHSEALSAGRSMRISLEQPFQQLLQDFETRSGWTHASLPAWTPVLVPA